jgi:hypothetical protein
MLPSVIIAIQTLVGAQTTTLLLDGIVQRHDRIGSSL